MKSNKRNILFTFDYEPYLGSNSGSAEKCVLSPTEAVVVILEKYNAKAIFFIDILYLLNLQRHTELKRDYYNVVSQIKGLYESGHYIFPHIHPHWLDARYIPKLRQFDLSKIERYSLSALEPIQITSLFEQSFELLNELGISYEVWGYRAGGWCIQPFNHYKDLFRKYNLKYDFSVLPNYRNENPDQFFDFSNLNCKEPYRFSEDILVQAEDGEFVEFPISTIVMSRYTLLLDRIVNKYLWKANDRGYGDGIGAQKSALKKQTKNTEMISLDLLNSAKLNCYKSYITNNNYMHWISHPKMFTRHGLKIFDKFMSYLDMNFEKETDFIKMKLDI